MNTKEKNQKILKLFEKICCKVVAAQYCAAGQLNAIKKDGSFKKFFKKFCNDWNIDKDPQKKALRKKIFDGWNLYFRAHKILAAQGLGMVAILIFEKIKNDFKQKYSKI